MLTLLANSLVLAQEVPAAEEPEGIDLLIPQTSELIAGILAFAIIFFFVWKWVLPAVNRTLEARREAITGQVTEAEKTREEAEKLLADYRKQIADARSEANAIVDDAKATAEGVKSDIVAKAQAEAQGITRKAREEAAAEMERATASVRSEIGSLSVELAQKATAGAMDASAHRALVEQFLEELDGMR
ncbi:MAG: F0F1 ATP synthase subunit B [Actinobacteria bacterium]|jgi:F-type H+-transporting ATPase subunit b|nr:F0F1 ATP synthase subunit B [Actinomycetota bacterium]